MTLKRIFNWVVGLPLAIIAIGFAVANREWVTVSFDPINRAMPFATLAMPLWALFFAGIFVGIFIGWFVAWRGAGKHRRSARDARIELVRVQQQHEREKRELQQSLPAVRPEAGP